MDLVSWKFSLTIDISSGTPEHGNNSSEGVIYKRQNISQEIDKKSINIITTTKGLGNINSE